MFQGVARQWHSHWCLALLCQDRKSTRLNSSHGYISYAVFCLKKKKHRHHPHYLVTIPELTLLSYTADAIRTEHLTSITLTTPPFITRCIDIMTHYLHSYAAI